MKRFALLACAAVLAVTSAGCSAIRGRRETVRLEKQLDTVHYQRPLDDVWQNLRQLLADQGYPLAEEDAKLVGQKPMGFAERIMSPEMATYSLGSDVGLLQKVGVVPKGETAKGYALETGWHRGTPRYRVHAEAAETSDGIAVQLMRIDEDVVDHREVPVRDPKLELELARRIDPALAQRVEAAAAAK